MCGRFDFHGDAADIAAAFNLSSGAPTWPPRYNVAPTNSSPVLLASASPDELRVEIAQFGWHRDFLRGGMVINARAETALERPMFRSAFTERRCIIPANGFFEWEKSGKQRLPWYFQSSEHPLFGFAGIFDTATDHRPASFVILTTQPNEKVAPYHDRMPVMLAPLDAKDYLVGTVKTAYALLRPYPAEMMQKRRVSKEVNRAGVEGPQCIAAG